MSGRPPRTPVKEGVGCSPAGGGSGSGTLCWRPFMLGVQFSSPVSADVTYNLKDNKALFRLNKGSTPTPHEYTVHHFSRPQSAMPWHLDEFLQEKVERGSRLLSESEQHRGSTDLQVGGGMAVEAAAPGSAMLGVLLCSCMHVAWRTDPLFRFSLQNFVRHCKLTVQLHNALLDDSNQPRQGLSRQDEEQVCAVLPSALPCYTNSCKKPCHAHSRQRAYYLARGCLVVHAAGNGAGAAGLPAQPSHPRDTLHHAPSVLRRCTDPGGCRASRLHGYPAVVR